MSDSEREYEYRHYGFDEETEEIIVAGGGMMNGNAYATVKVYEDSTIRYKEYGKFSRSEFYENHYLEFDEDGYEFDIVPYTEEEIAGNH